MTFKKVDQEDWLREAKLSYERAFGKKDLESLETFNQIEEFAVQEGNRLARWILQKKLESKCADHPESGEALCPLCRKPAPPKEGVPEPREIIARPGAVGIERQAHYCRHCRKSFFPSGSATRPEVGELQSLDPGKGRMGGGQPGVVREGQRGGEEIPKSRDQREGNRKSRHEIRRRAGKQKRR